jgi:hypothetical protein
MYDSDVPGDIPANAQIVMGYVDTEPGAWTSADFDRFPLARHVTITRDPSVILAEVLDVETGAATPAVAPVWAKKVRFIGGLPPVVYVGLDTTYQPTVEAFEAQGVAQPLYGIADWDQNPVVPDLPGAVFKQFLAPGFGAGGHYDVSVVIPSWPEQHQPPAPPTLPPGFFKNIWVAIRKMLWGR